MGCYPCTIKREANFYQQKQGYPHDYRGYPHDHIDFTDKNTLCTRVYSGSPTGRHLLPPSILGAAFEGLINTTMGIDTYVPYVGKKHFSKIVIYWCNLGLNILEILRMCIHVGNNAYTCLFRPDALAVIMRICIENYILSDSLAEIMRMCNKKDTHKILRTIALSIIYICSRPLLLVCNIAFV